MLLLNSYDTISSLVSLHVPCSRKLFLVYCRHVLLSSLKRLGFVYWHEVVHIRHACISLHPWTTMHMSKSRSLEENLPPPLQKKKLQKICTKLFSARTSLLSRSTKTVSCQQHLYTYVTVSLCLYKK